MNATIYIKKEDEELWAKVKNKSEFVSSALNGEEFNPFWQNEKLRKLINHIVEEKLENIRNY